MRSMQDLLTALYTDFAELPCAVTHYRKITDYPYAVWAEDGEDDSFHGDNHKQEQSIRGYIDYFTKHEFDQTVDDIQEILNRQPVAWLLESVDYEDLTNLIHYKWSWVTR